MQHFKTVFEKHLLVRITWRTDIPRPRGSPQGFLSFPESRVACPNGVRVKFTAPYLTHIVAVIPAEWKYFRRTIPCFVSVLSVRPTTHAIDRVFVFLRAKLKQFDYQAFHYSLIQCRACLLYSRV